MFADGLHPGRKLSRPGAMLRQILPRLSVRILTASFEGMPRERRNSWCPSGERRSNSVCHRSIAR